MRRNHRACPPTNEPSRQPSGERKSARIFNVKARGRLPWPIEMVSTHSLRPAERNARAHSKKQIQQIAESMVRFGVINPLIADDRGRIVAGHARAEAAKLIGLKQVPVIRVSHLSETEI
jgi:hypothetical protein